jgi:hypothetical protein
LLARAVLPLAILFILSACGGSPKPKAQPPAVARGPGFSFSVPSGWSTRKTATALVARKGAALVSVATFTLQKPYKPSLFSRAAKELDGVAAKLAAQVGGKLTESKTTNVDGRKIRAYRFANSTVQTRIGFVLDGKREYQLLCQMPVGGNDRDGACALLFGSFSVAPGLR